jgi:5-methylthioadenosine/S-adenosylhomocysteine deaminase
VLCADTSNVDTVIIGGKVQKRNGKLVADWESARMKLEASRDRLIEALAKRNQEQQAAT